MGRTALMSSFNQCFLLISLQSINSFLTPAAGFVLRWLITPKQLVRHHMSGACSPSQQCCSSQQAGALSAQPSLRGRTAALRGVSHPRHPQNIRQSLMTLHIHSFCSKQPDQQK